MLDTGSGMSVISEETAKRLGIKPVARGGMARAVGGGGRFEIVYGFLSSMELGEVRVTNVPIYIRRFYSSSAPVDGYIGLSVISKYLATVDYGAHQFTLTRQRATDDAKKSETVQPSSFEIPMRVTSSGFLSSEVNVEGIGRPLNFIIDTGADLSVISEFMFKDEDMASFVRNERLTVYGAAGVAENVTTLLLPRVTIGANMREGVRAVVLDLDPVNETAGFNQSGILGSNFLQHYRVTFDFQRAVMRLEQLRGDAQKKESAPPDASVPEQP